MPRSSRSFRVHDFFDILVAEGVPAAIVDQFDFHLNYFEVDEQEQSSLRKLEVYPFEAFEPDAGESSHYATAGKYGTYWYSTDEQLAVRNTDDGFELYSSAGVNIYPFLQELLLNSRAAFVHAAGFVDSTGGATLLPGSGGVGKTSLLGELVMKDGVEVLSDDVVCLSAEGECYSFPRSFVFKHYHRDVYPEVFEQFNLERKQQRDKIATAIINFTIKNAPFIGVTKRLLHRFGYYNKTSSALSRARGGNYLATIPVGEIFGDDAIASSGPLERVVFLRRADQSDFSFEPISRKRLERRLFSIILREWQEDISVLLELGSFELIDVHAYFDEMSTIIAEAIAGVPRYEFVIPSDAPPESLSDKFCSEIDFDTNEPQDGSK